MSSVYSGSNFSVDMKDLLFCSFKVGEMSLVYKDGKTLKIPCGTIDFDRLQYQFKIYKSQ